MNKTIVLIPHYNNNNGLIKSMQAISEHENIDVLIVDDGSNKNFINEQKINSVAKFNGKIQFLYLEKNSGIEIALNKGLEFIKNSNQYLYIARLDCDDICLENRFKIQEEFLNNHPNVYLVGSNATAINTKGDFLFNTRFPETYSEIRKKMYLNSMHLHPCVMFRSEILTTVGLYPTNYKAAEDYAYFFEIVNRYETYNIKKSLMLFQIDDVGISATKRSLQVKNRIKIIYKHFYWGFWPIYGLVRNSIIFLIPNNILKYVKKNINTKK